MIHEKEIDQLYIICSNDIRPDGIVWNPRRTPRRPAIMWQTSLTAMQTCKKCCTTGMVGPETSQAVIFPGKAITKNMCIPISLHLMPMQGTQHLPDVIIARL